MNTKQGLHTFSLTIKSSYSDIQNLCTNEPCIKATPDKFHLNTRYEIIRWKDCGVEIQLYQSLTRPSWIKLIVNPSSLLAGHYCPTELFQPTKKKLKRVTKHLQSILDDLNLDKELQDFKLSRADLTWNLYFSSKADSLQLLDYYKKSYLMRPYRVIQFGEHSGNSETYKGANRHSWTIGCKACSFCVYDKTYELAKRHHIMIDDEILRFELRLTRNRIRQLTECKIWDHQLLELYEQQDCVLSKFLHRLHQDYTEIVTTDEALTRINNSNFHKKTKKQMRRLVEKMSDCESLAAARKRMKLKEKDFIRLLDKFRKFGISPITIAN